LAATFGVPVGVARDGLERLHAARALVLDARTREVRMASPFSKVDHFQGLLGAAGLTGDAWSLSPPHLK
jgi:hypothetical protein